jgi:hypothetical protein
MNEYENWMLPHDFFIVKKLDAPARFFGRKIDSIE